MVNIDPTIRWWGPKKVGGLLVTRVNMVPFSEEVFRVEIVEKILKGQLKLLKGDNV